MIDFTNYKTNIFRYYDGRNGGKICAVYGNMNYMLKFPIQNIKTDKSGTNSCISEFV